jgi:hypothetical protein
VEIAHDAFPWLPWSPREVARRLEGVTAPWAVAAGRALELFAGAGWRGHDDVEISVPVSRFGEVRAALAGLELWVPVGGGRLRPLVGADEPGQTWALDGQAGAWRLDVLREPADGGTWVYRRDSNVRMPYTELIERTVEGIPFLRPEVVLLFKAAAPRVKDEADFDAVLPLLDPERRAWLRTSLRALNPSHAWIERL